MTAIAAEEQAEELMTKATTEGPTPEFWDAESLANLPLPDVKFSDDPGNIPDYYGGAGGAIGSGADEGIFSPREEFTEAQQFSQYLASLGNIPSPITRSLQSARHLPLSTSYQLEELLSPESTPSFFKYLQGGAKIPSRQAFQNLFAQAAPYFSEAGVPGMTMDQEGIRDKIRDDLGTILSGYFQAGVPRRFRAGIGNIVNRRIAGMLAEDPEADIFQRFIQSGFNL